jgi:cytidyltransferase-like protein
MKEKIVNAEQLNAIGKKMRDQGRKLVLTNGCFDLLHVGHVRYLQAARALGNALAVAINAETDRAEVIAALECVDHVIIFAEVRATQLIEKVHPAIYVKGGDYTRETLHAEERAALERIGTEIRILPFEKGHSTSSLIEKIRKIGAP